MFISNMPWKYPLYSSSLQSTSPDFEFYAIDSSNVIVGGGKGFILNVYTRPGTSHLIVDLSLPYQSNAAVMHLWKASVLYNGKNIPCVGELTEAYVREVCKKINWNDAYVFGRYLTMFWFVLPLSTVPFERFYWMLVKFKHPLIERDCTDGTLCEKIENIEISLFAE